VDADPRPVSRPVAFNGARARSETTGVGLWQQRQQAYPAPGVYTVTMAVTDSAGATSSKTVTVS